jgi:hypothetical protein
LIPLQNQSEIPLEERLYEDADYPLPNDGKEHPMHLYDHRGNLMILADGARPATPEELEEAKLTPPRR